MIKTAVIEQAPAIESLMKLAFAEVKNIYTEAAYNATVITSGEIVKRIHEGPLWIASFGSEIIGTVSALIKDNSVYIRGMAVHPGHRGKRTGEKLLEETEKFANECNIQRLYLGTTKYLNSAIKLYERNGFVKYGIENFYGMDLFMYEKLLK